MRISSRAFIGDVFEVAKSKIMNTDSFNPHGIGIKLVMLQSAFDNCELLLQTLPAGNDPPGQSHDTRIRFVQESSEQSVLPKKYTESIT